MISSRTSTDVRLLNAFVQNDDQHAFAELVDRYAIYVTATCRNSLHAGGDIDDAVQLTFLTLANHATSLSTRIESNGTISGWLHRVAVNAALQQNRASRARSRREKIVGSSNQRSPRNPHASLESDEVRIILTEELQSLPSDLRQPLMLCLMQGKSQQEAARYLGVSYGTFRRRLEHGRKILRSRLGRRGIVTTGTLMYLTKGAEASNSHTFPAATLIKSRVTSTPSQSVTTVTSWKCGNSASIGFGVKSLVAASLLICAVPSVFAVVSLQKAETPEIKARPVLVIPREPSFTSQDFQITVDGYKNVPEILRGRSTP